MLRDFSQDPHPLKSQREHYAKIRRRLFKPCALNKPKLALPAPPVFVEPDAFDNRPIFEGGWTKADDDRLIMLAMAGYSSTAMASKFPNRSRSAVGGRLYRLRCRGLVKAYERDEQPPVAAPIGTVTSILSMQDAIPPLSELKQDKRIPIPDIIAAVSRVSGISVEAMLGQGRSRANWNARNVAYYLCRRLTGKSYPKIGAEFGDRDHSSIMNGRNVVDSNLPRYTPAIIACLAELGLRTMEAGDG